MMSTVSNAEDSADANSSPRVASMIELIAFPDRYAGEFVAVKGYFGIDTLFLTKDNADMRDYASSIMISDTAKGEIYSSGCSDHYVEIWGNVSLSFGGRVLLKDITKISFPSSLESCFAATE